MMIISQPLKHTSFLVAIATSHSNTTFFAYIRSRKIQYILLWNIYSINMEFENITNVINFRQAPFWINYDE